MRYSSFHTFTTSSLINEIISMTSVLISVMLKCRRRRWYPTPVLLPGKSHGWKSLVGCSPWSCEELDTTEWLHFHFSLSCIGEGNGNQLQCLCWENPRDGGAWWAAVCGVAQSQTWLKRLSSSSSSRKDIKNIAKMVNCDWGLETYFRWRIQEKAMFKLSLEGWMVSLWRRGLVMGWERWWWWYSWWCRRWWWWWWWW